MNCSNLLAYLRFVLLTVLFISRFENPLLPLRTRLDLLLAIWIYLLSSHLSFRFLFLFYLIQNLFLYHWIFILFLFNLNLSITWFLIHLIGFQNYFGIFAFFLYLNDVIPKDLHLILKLIYFHQFILQNKLAFLAKFIFVKFKLKNFVLNFW